MLKLLTRVLPTSARTALRRAYHRWQLGRGKFRSPEPEWDRLAEWLSPGDLALDIGANVGHYTARMSELVGLSGRVVAVEPVPETFRALAANSLHFRYRNVTLLNVAAGHESAVCGLTVPDWPDGTPNGYLARIDPRGADSCLAVRIDALALPGPVRFVKIDAEGYEARVLAGMKEVLERDRPVVVLERNKEAGILLESLGYVIAATTVRSPNSIALPAAAPLRRVAMAEAALVTA